jgi:hypothetical protein
MVLVRFEAFNSPLGVCKALFTFALDVAALDRGDRPDVVDSIHEVGCL